MDYFVKIKNYLYSLWRGLWLVPSVRPVHLSRLYRSLSKRELYLLTAAIVLCLTSGGFLISGKASSGGTIAPAVGGDYTEGLVGQPRFINPILAPVSAVDSDLSRLVYAQLLKFDSQLNLIPDLAESLPEISEDQKTFTFKLKSGLRWQDGRPILTDDIIFTVQTIQNPDFESPLRAAWNRVKAEKIDDLTVAFTLRDVSASFVTNFTLGILPKHIWDNLSPAGFRLSDSNLKPIGAGPFSVKEIRKTSEGVIRSITLEGNKYYHQGRPFIKHLTFKFYPDPDALITAYQGREIEGLGYLPFDRKVFVEQSEKYNQYLINLPQYQAVFFNLLKNPVLTDKAVRQALWLVTDRQQIIDEVFLGAAKQAYGPILEGNLGYNPSIKEATHYSAEEAVQILEKGGWVLDADSGIRTKKNQALEFTLATNNSVFNVKTAQILQNQWSKIGAKINLAIVSQTELNQQYIKTRSFDALLFAENTGADPDPFSFWHSTQVRDPGLNLSGFNHAEVDRLLTVARQTVDVNVRDANYQRFQEIISNELPAIFLTSAVFVYNVPKKIKGIELETIIQPSERFLNMDNWYIDTKRK